MSLRQEPFFLGTGAGRRFALATWPEGAPRGGVLYVHPFAEELNRSRRMTALAARDMARAGWLVLQLDLTGCGDSAGDFGDATWAGWIDDLDQGWRWLHDRVHGPVHVWSLRVGGLLASAWLAHRASGGDRLADWLGTWLMWQPVLQGKSFLTQFLRIRLGSDLAASPDARSLMEGLRRDLAQGRPVEVAGYLLAPDLAVGLEATPLALPAGWAGPVALLEVPSSATSGLSPVLTTLSERWQSTGVHCHVQAVHGPRFWQTAETEVAMELVGPSLAALEWSIQERAARSLRAVGAAAVERPAGGQAPAEGKLT